jgi:hypothetical protein
MEVFGRSILAAGKGVNQERAEKTERTEKSEGGPHSDENGISSPPFFFSIFYLRLHASPEAG